MIWQSDIEIWQADMGTHEPLQPHRHKLACLLQQVFNDKDKFVCCRGERWSDAEEG